MTVPPLPPARRPTARAAERLRQATGEAPTGSTRLRPRPDPAIAPAIYGGDVGGFLRRRRVIKAAFDDAYDRRDASAFLYEKAERLAGVLLGVDP